MEAGRLLFFINLNKRYPPPYSAVIIMTTTIIMVFIKMTLLNLCFNMKDVLLHKCTPAEFKNQRTYPIHKGGYIIVDFLNSIFSFFTDPGIFPVT